MKKICAIHGIWNQEHSNQRCPKCDKSYSKFERDQESQNVYHSKKWRDLRKKVLLRDGYCCTSCSKIIGLKPRDHIVDHIIEIKRGGEKFDIENLTTLCQECHNKKTKGTL